LERRQRLTAFNFLSGLPVDTKVSLSQGSLQSEFYKSISDIDFVEQGVELAEETNMDYVFEARQNEPNPFSTTTDIPVHTRVGMELTLSIYDMRGSLIHQKRKYFPAGNSVWTIHAEEIPREGNYLYQISNDDHVIIKKMIMIR